jgi:nicotinate-nucleotide pyrophosphorylase (carboxylating)
MKPADESRTEVLLRDSRGADDPVSRGADGPIGRGADDPVSCGADGPIGRGAGLQPCVLPREAYVDLVRRALEEDLGCGDVTSRATIDETARARGILLAKSPCVVAGLDIAFETFRQLDPGVTIRVLRPDGTSCAPGDEIAEVTGLSRALLACERTALNFLQRLSGTATLARRFVEAGSGRITILDTRKTTPTFRALEKYAVGTGGATNHRMRLDDGVLIKDNHLRLAGGVREAVRRAKAADVGLPIEVEVETLDEVDAALEAGADMLLLDNMATPAIEEAVRRARGRATTEISGGVTLARLPELAHTGADFVSVGALTHSAPSADISFELYPVG